MRVLGSAMPVSRPAVTTLRAELRPVPDVGGGQRAGSDRRQPLEPVAARPRLLISYSRADAEAVRRLQGRLKEAGLATFLDRDRLPAGQPWQPMLERGI